MPILLSNVFKEGPPDLEELFKRVGRKITGRKKHPILNSSGPRFPNASRSSSLWWGLIALLLLAVTLVFSSVVTVQPNQVLVVSRFGAFSHLEQPGLHWTIPLVDRRNIVDLSAASSIESSGTFLTTDGSLIQVKTALTYVITDAQKYTYLPHLNAILDAQLKSAALNVLLNHNLSDLLAQNNFKALEQSIASALPNDSIYGIQIKGVTLMSMRVPAALSQQFTASISTAKDAVATMIENANQFAKNLQPLAAEKARISLGYANHEQFSVVVNAAEDAAELRSLLPAYQDYPAATLAYLPLLLQHSSQDLKSLSSTGNSMISGINSSEAAYSRWALANQDTQQASNEKNNDDQNN